MSPKPQAPFGQDVIKQCIPHRDPMLMLTKVLSVEGLTIKAENFVSEDAPFFKGHFPNRPIMPGVLIIETVAQAGAMLIELACDIDSELQFVAFGGVDKAKFRRPVKPNDTLCVEVEIVKTRGVHYKFSGKVHVDDALVAQVDFSAAIMNF